MTRAIDRKWLEKQQFEKLTDALQVLVLSLEDFSVDSSTNCKQCREKRFQGRRALTAARKVSKILGEIKSRTSRI
jgi:hypothetical protein